MRNATEEFEMEDDFLNDLMSFCKDDESDLLNVSVTGDKEEDARRVQNSHQANYFLKLHKLVCEEEAEVEAFVKAELENHKELLQKYKEKTLAPILRKKEYFEFILRQFAQAQLEGKTKKSLALPYGTLAFKKSAPTWDYYDEDMIIGYLKASNLEKLIRTKTEENIDKKEFKKTVNIKDGNPFIGEDLIEGLRIIEKEDTFTIK